MYFVTETFDPAAPDELRIALRRTGLLTVSHAEWAGMVARLGGDGWPTGLSPSAVVLCRGGAGPVLVQWLDGDRPATLEVSAAVAPGLVVDTNGAGDAHLGALLAALHRGEPWLPALIFASRAAAWSVTRPGAASGPTLADL